MSLWKLIRNKLYRPILIESWQRGLLSLNGRVSRALEPGVHRVWHRPDLHIDLRVWDTRHSVLTGLEPDLEAALPRNWVRPVDVGLGQSAIVSQFGVPTAYLPPGHHLVWTLERPPEVQLFDTASDPLPAMTPELRRLLPADVYVAGTVPEDHIGLLFRDGVCSQILAPGAYGFWQGRQQLRVALQNVKQSPFLPIAYGHLVGVTAEELELRPDEAALIWFDGKPAHWLPQAGRHLIVKRDRKLEIERFDLMQSAPELTRAQKEVIPSGEYIEARIGPGEVGILISPKDTRKPLAMGPGRKTIWTRGETLNVLKANPVQDPMVAPALLDVVPEDWTSAVEVAHHELAVVRLGGRPLRVLVEGQWRVWNVAAALASSGGRASATLELAIEKIDSRSGAPDPKAAYFALLPAGSYAATNVSQGQVGILRRAGRIEGLVEPGEHLFWNLEKNVTAQVVDLRPQSLQVNSQEMLTKDKVSLRLNLAVVWRVAEPLVAVERFSNVGDMLYLKLQLATRRFVGSRTLDEILEGRDELERVLKQHMAEQVEGTGIAVEEVGLKDLILPGTMRGILNRVVEAQRQAEADNIRRREETAATRSLANTARVLANNPVLLRLKELEHIRGLADSIGQVNLVVSSHELSTLMGFPGMTPMAQLGTGQPPAESESNQGAEAAGT